MPPGYPRDSLVAFAHIAAECVAPLRKDRPDMPRVTFLLAELKRPAALQSVAFARFYTGDHKATCPTRLFSLPPPIFTALPYPSLVAYWIFSHPQCRCNGVSSSRGRMCCSGGCTAVHKASSRAALACLFPC
ncbi:unnamed protein product [Closterium sp. NIES-64]|nr:unnamed protein product [Closterium sp. NIES-64]